MKYIVSNLSSYFWLCWNNFFTFDNYDRDKFIRTKRKKVKLSYNHKKNFYALHSNILLFIK